MSNEIIYSILQMTVPEQKGADPGCSYEWKKLRKRFLVTVNLPLEEIKKVQEEQMTVTNIQGKLLNEAMRTRKV